jgi:capsular exopolysaccharide synthesis family protein
MTEIENKKINSGNSADIFDPKRIINQILQNWYYFIASIIIAVSISHYTTNKATSIYAIEGTLLINEDQNSLGLDLFSSATPTLKNTQLENQKVFLNTYSLALRTVERLNLNTNYYTEEFWGYRQIYNQQIPILTEVNWDHNQLERVKFEITPQSDTTFSLQLLDIGNSKVFNRISKDKSLDFQSVDQNLTSRYSGTYGESLKTEYFEFIIYKLTDYSEEIFFSFMDDNILANSFKKQVLINPVNDESSVLKIGINHPDRVTGSEYVNALMATFLENDLEQKNLATQQTLDFIENQIVTINDSINLYENQIENFRQVNKITDISSKGSIILTESIKLDEELNRQSSTLDFYKNLKKYLDTPDSKELLIPSIAGIQDPIINTMVTELIALQNEKAGLSGVLIGDSFSYTRELNNRLKNLKGNLNESITNAIVNIEIQIERIQGLVGSVDRDLNKLPEVERNLISIQRRFKVNESIYTLLLEKRAETEIKKASTTTNHQIYDEAMINPSPISPNRNRNYALGLALGMSIPLFILVVWSLFYHKISDPKELEELLDIPIIGTIPREKDTTEMLSQMSKSMTTESFRNIRSSLAIRFNFKDKGVVLVTSAKSGEGKTYISIKIASIYAALGKKTLILGMDLRKPRLHKELNLNNDRGVTTYLLQESEDWEDMIQSTTQENLFVLSAGPYLERISELINTPRFESLILSLKSKYDFIIIDTPPIALVSETLDLTKYSDVNLFIFRQNFSFINQANVANDLKNKFEIENLYAIINDTYKTGLGDYSYGYGYGYGYYANYEGYLDNPSRSRISKFFSRKK